MKATEFHIRARLFVGNDHYHSDREHAKFLDELRALLRRDWAVRVLDAWAASGRTVQIDHEQAPAAAGLSGVGSVIGWKLWLIATTGKVLDTFRVNTPDAARLAAALAVFLTLPADVRAKLGECP